MSQKRSRLGEELVAAGLISEEKLSAGLSIQKSEGGYLGDVLVQHGLIDENVLLRFNGERSGAQFITADSLSRLKLDDPVLEKVPVRKAEQLTVLPIRYDSVSDALHVAMPEAEPSLVDQVREVSGATHVHPVLATRAAVRAGISRFYYADIYAFAALQTGAKAMVAESETQVVARSGTPSSGSPSVPGMATPAQGTPVIPGWAAPAAQAPPPAEPLSVPAPSAAAGSQTPQAVLKLYETLEQQQRQNKLLMVANALMHHLARDRNISEIFHRVLAFAFDNLPADEGVLLLRDESTGQFVPVAVRTQEGGQSEVQVSATLLKEVQSSRQGVLTADAVFDPRFRHSQTVVLSRLRSAMGVPLIVEGEVRGILALSTRSRVGAFGPPDLELLSAIATQTAVAVENVMLNRRLTSDLAKRERLSRFMSPALVEMATSGALELGESGEQQEATVLFADIRGFTSLSERLSPKEVVALLNEHFEAMVEVLFKHGGILDKFVGDALMALWGVPTRREDDSARSLTAALEMLRRVSEMNQVRRQQGREVLEVGIGINTGMVVFGAIGASRRLDLTAIGDVVNIASRLCDMAEADQVIVSQSTLQAAKGSFLAMPLPPVLLRGKTKEVTPYRVLGEAR
ncbi:MAG: GAF domain-containing protein [Myxococcales bacterium]|nr:GAF domain-containing protein [Myxococcales bacterium]